MLQKSKIRLGLGCQPSVLAKALIRVVQGVGISLPMGGKGRIGHHRIKTEVKVPGVFQRVVVLDIPQRGR